MAGRIGRIPSLKNFTISKLKIPANLSVTTLKGQAAWGRMTAAVSTLPTKAFAVSASFGDSAKLILSSPFAARAEVVRDADGSVIGPPSQYVLSAFNKGKDPFTPRTLAKMTAYFALLYAIMKAGVFNSPASLTSLADDIGDTAVAAATAVWDGQMPTQTPRYLDGFMSSAYKCSPARVESGKDVPGTTCYQPGGTYYQHAAKNPGEVRLWGYAGGLSDKSSNTLFGGLALAGIAAFLYRSRNNIATLLSKNIESAQKALDDAVKSEKADGITSAKLALQAAQAAETAAVGAIRKFAALSAMPAVASAVLFGVGRELAHPVATWSMLTAGWWMLSHEYRAPLFGTKEMSLRWALPVGALWIGGDVLYRALADSAGIYQLRPDGYASIYGNWLDWNWAINLPFLATDVMTDCVLVAPIWARSGMVINRTVDVLVAQYAQWIHANQKNPGAVRQFFQNRVPNLGPDSPHLNVRQQVQAFAAEERAAVAAGRAPDGLMSAVFGHALTAGSVGALGYVGFNALQSVVDGDSHHVLADVVLGGLGMAGVGGMAHGLWHAAQGNNGVRNYYMSLASYLGHQFGPKGRAPYWLVYTLVGTAISFANGLTSQTIKGIDPDEGYAANIGVRSALNPWVNRIVMGMRTAYGTANISAFSFFAPGFFTLYNGLEFGAESGQMTKSAMLMYETWARDYTLIQSAESKAALLDSMHALEGLARDARDNNGYGRTDTASTATALVAKIAAMKVQYSIPERADISQ